MALSMAFVLPIASENALLGSGVVVDVQPGFVLVATALHLFGECKSIRIGLPPHGGDCTAVQSYPVPQFPAFEAHLIASNPLADIGILGCKVSGGGLIPPLADRKRLPKVGARIVALGYPFAPIGSCLETWVPGVVTARTRRLVTANVGIDEFVISNQSHPGSSGSAVVGQDDGILYGILRGSLSPPDLLRIGNIPVATDTSVTFVVSAHYIAELLPQARIIFA